MKIRDLFASKDEEQRERVDGPTLREVAASRGEQPYSGYQEEYEVLFRTGLPGDDMTGHPCLPEHNPYLFVPPSELEYLLKNKKDISAESRTRISEALAMLRSA